MAGGEPEAASRLAGSLNNLAGRLAELGQREDALAAVEDAVTIRWELAARWPDAYTHELVQSLKVVAWLEDGEDLSDASPQEPAEVITVRYPIVSSAGRCFGNRTAASARVTGALAGGR